MTQDKLRTLLEAHETIILEREEAKEMMADTEFGRGHINGLNEARNCIEELIMEHAGLDEAPNGIKFETDDLM